MTILNHTFIFVLLLTSFPAFAQSNNSELPAPLKCYTYRYNDPSGARGRSDLSDTPVMQIVSGDFNSATPRSQKVHVSSLNSAGGIINTDFAKATMVRSFSGDNRGTEEFTLTIRVEAQYGNVIWKDLTLARTFALDSNNRLYAFWLNRENSLSCFDPAHLPR